MSGRVAHHAKPAGAAPGSASRAVAIDAMLAHQHADMLDIEIRRIVKSTRFEFDSARRWLRLLGPDHFYHAFDAELEAHLLAFGLPAGAEAASFYRRIGTGGWCLEDCWSGRLIAEILVQCPADDPLVLLHVDDHEDMMPTLLERRGGRLTDPVTGLGFDPLIAEDWDSPIRSGTVGIGNFITPLFHSGRTVHVRHLNNTRNSDRLAPAGPAGIRYPLIPEIEFAAVSRDCAPDQATGSYLAATDPKRALTELPPGQLIVHIDFDYFINDFNGNSGRKAGPRDAAINPRCLAKFEALFAAILDLGRPVRGWVVATSPGFCASRHWRKLFANLERHLGERYLPDGLFPSASVSGTSSRIVAP